MTERDIQKVLAAGFSIIKIERASLRIKIRSHNSTWKSLDKKFANSRDMEAYYYELLKHPKNIEA